MIELTSRQRKLLRKLCLNDGYRTVSSLARSVDASIRTTRNDLRSLEAFVAQYGVVLERVPGTGIRLDCNVETRKKLQQQADRTDLHTLSAAEQCAVAELLLLLHPLVTFQRIADACRVSRQTIMTNFRDVESFFAQAGLSCQRDRGKGICLEGRELDMRRSFLGLVSNASLQGAIYPLAHKELAEKLADARKILDAVETFQSGTYSDRNRLELVAAYSLTRVSRGFPLEEDRDRHAINDPSAIGLSERDSAEDLNDPELLALVQLLSTYFTSETERVFLASVILSQRSAGGESLGCLDETYQDEASDISRDLVNALRELHVIEEEPLRHLIDGLTMHIRAAIWRVRNGNQIQSDTPRQIMVSIPLLYDFTRKQMCTAEEKYNVSFNESEIAYIAMYLDTIYETSARESTVLNVLFLCSFGLASSSILKMRLSHVLAECNVYGPITTAEALSFLDTHDVDLIISTNEFHSEKTPVIIVDPLLNQEALAKVKNKLAQASYSKMCAHFLRSYAHADRSMDLPCSVHDLVRREDIQVGVSCADWREAIQIAATPLLKRGVIEQRYVDRMISAVEDFGPYMVLTPGTAYVHAGIHDGIHENCLAICVLDKSIPFGPAHEKNIRTIVVLGVHDKERSDLLNLAPILECEDNIRQLEREDIEIDDVWHLHG